MFKRFKNPEMVERTAEVARMESFLLPLRDGSVVSANLANVGFSVEYFFNPTNFKV
jgi:mannitol-1-phosphate/altronate dehydrogenase